MKLKIIPGSEKPTKLPFLDYALFAVEDNDTAIRLTGSSTINGMVGTNAKTFDSLEFTGTSGINGELQINTDPPEQISEPPEEYIEEPREPEWSENRIYTWGEKVYYDGLHYEARWWTRSTPGTNQVWEVIIPDDEIWHWFDNHQYDKGDQVWYEGQLYTAKEQSRDSPPPGWAWESSDNNEIENFVSNITYLEEEIEFPESEMPDFPSPPEKADIKIKGNDTEEILQDGSYDKISITANNDLIIDRLGGDRIIRVDELDIQQGHIKFKNPDDDGVLRIYVEEELNLNGSSSINITNDPAEVEIYYAGSKKLDFEGNITLNANLFIDDADLKLQGSSSKSGYIFSGGGDIDLSGDINTSLIYAPKSDLEMNGSSSLKGTAVVNTLTGDGDISIDYQESELDDIPPNFLNAISDFDDYFESEDDESLADIIEWGKGLK